MRITALPKEKVCPLFFWLVPQKIQKQKVPPTPPLKTFINLQAHPLSPSKKNKQKKPEEIIEYLHKMFVHNQKR